MIYLDYAATAPMKEEAIQTYIEAVRRYPGNPSSLHDSGSEAEDLFEQCKEKLADLLHGDKKGIYFTSGGSESNDLAIRSIAKGNAERGRHIITTKLEHPSVLSAFAALEEDGFQVTYLPVDEHGLVSLSSIENSLSEQTILVALQHVNHEIGTTQAIKDIGLFLKSRGIILHCDCVQSFGKLPIDVKELNIDSLSISSHKVGGPKGVGAVYINPSIHWKSVYHHATHQKGFRPGTINVPGIASFITAASISIDEMDKYHSHYVSLKEHWSNLIRPYSSSLKIEGMCQLPSIIGMTSNCFQGQFLMLECNRRQLAVSVGSACHIGQQNPATTITAIGKSIDEANRFIRISLGPNTVTHHLDLLFNALLPYLKTNEAI
ncbi:aminotransferase class V-fold PLP-dependent enzyme [Jeotgalibacillus sp. S-D1]|uniref:IscS subfamily cysteine desulfurase n=1 Tax=Jeotgalibacillus sp. S-D1 TaxID=2552189 RepID=UPI0010593071|nr:IscS subfamily cysteine desulfurase [Jeotgalibacillus sp. S-D1]TDL30637.1 aminotransferase class V-fold PLP-dependent enzyme [Jeotgalibacillus sp. S-D1]